MLITDPAFYAVAVPAVLLVGISKSGFGSGFGALGVPLMALVVPVPQAVAIMLPLLLVMDALGLKALWRARDAALFAAINAAKWGPYAWLGLIDSTNMTTAAMLLPAAPLGVWLGLRVGRWISARRFYQVFELGLLLTGAKLLWDGFKPLLG